MQTLKVLITVKTYPIPSAKYDELVAFYQRRRKVEEVKPKGRRR